MDAELQQYRRSQRADRRQGHDKNPPDSIVRSPNCRQQSGPESRQQRGYLEEQVPAIRPADRPVVPLLVVAVQFGGELFEFGLCSHLGRGEVSWVGGSPDVTFSEGSTERC